MCGTIDIAEVLELQNIRQNLQDFDDDEKGVYTIYTLGGEQEFNEKVEALKQICIAEDITISSVMRKIIKQYLADKNNPNAEG